MDVVTAAPAKAKPIPFDPVCGSPLPALFEANPYCAGGYVYYFCSAMCRRFFIDQRDGERRSAGARQDRSVPLNPTACS